MAGAASAQSYSFETVNKQTYVFNDRMPKEMHLKIQNNGPTSIGITWKVLQPLDTNKWGSFSFCDPSQCYYIVEENAEYVAEVGSHALGDFKLSVWAKPGAVLDTYAVTFHETGNTSVIDTITYILDARSLSIADGHRPVKSIAVYPNPCANILNLDITGAKQVVIYDMKGQEVRRETVSGRVVSTEALKPGMYMVQCTSGDEIYRARFVKM
jgi:hypothetical protein